MGAVSRRRIRKRRHLRPLGALRGQVPPGQSPKLDPGEFFGMAGLDDAANPWRESPLPTWLHQAITRGDPLVVWYHPVDAYTVRTVIGGFHSIEPRESAHMAPGKPVFARQLTTHYTSFDGNVAAEAEVDTRMRIVSPFNRRKTT